MDILQYDKENNTGKEQEESSNALCIVICSCITCARAQVACACS